MHKKLLIAAKSNLPSWKTSFTSETSSSDALMDFGENTL